jgi:hypothetical protein
MSKPLVIPPSEQLKAELLALREECRAKRRLLDLARAAEAAQQRAAERAALGLSITPPCKPRSPGGGGDAA